MKKRQAVELLLNGEKRDHGQVIVGLLKKAERLECMAAFAKTSAFQGVLKALQASLAHGLEARFAIGLDFYLTEPALLRKLMEMGKKHALELYLSASSETFHPKIYAFSHVGGCSVLVGSANLTAGGLRDNYEASALVDDPDGALTASITNHFNELIADGTLVPATKLRIDDYARDYAIHDACRKVARRRAANVNQADGISIEVLHDILELMKSDSSSNGFKSQQSLRSRNLRQARRKLGELGSLSGAGRGGFRPHYEELIALFHSGGLHRAKSRIASHAHKFLEAVAAVVDAPRLSPRGAYDLLLTHFMEVTGAGVNLLTEILHALDNKRFAVMNQNAVSGMALANLRAYPRHPTKQSVDAKCYAEYCQQADTVRKALGLADFTELDALFNYAYWGSADGEEVA